MDDDAAVVKRQQAALVEAAEAVLSESGVQVDEVLGHVSWEDPNVRPFVPQPVSPEALMRLGRCVLALRRRPIPSSSPARPPPVDVREALARCRRAREHLSLDGYLFEPWTDLLEAMAARMVGRSLCALCAADVPHTDSVCCERRERRLRVALKELADATDSYSISSSNMARERLDRALESARVVLSETGP